MSRAAAATPKRVNPGTSAALLGAVLNEVEALRDRVNSHDRILAPAFAPREESDSMNTRGPGAHPAEPVVMRQASTALSDWGPEARSPGAGRPRHRQLRPRPGPGRGRVRAARRRPRARAGHVREPRLVREERVQARHAVPEPEPEPAPVRWDELPERAPSEPGFAQARARAPQVPGHTGEVIQGPGGS